MIVLGVDPGTQRTGAGLISSVGNRYELLHFEVFKIRYSLPLAAKLLQIYESLSEIIAKHRPEVLALEDVFFATNVNAMVRLGEARACAMLAASAHGIEVVEYMPTQVKSSVSGNGRASKEQIQFMIKRLLNLKEVPPPDGADALAVAICHLHHCRTAQTMKTENKKTKKSVRLQPQV